MAPIVVDPEVLAGSGVSVSSVGDEIAAAVNTLAAALPNGAMAGHDRAGLAFGQAYQQSAQALMDAAGAAVGGGRKVGFGVQLSATNYSRADASSTIGGGGVPLTPPSAPGEFDAPSVPSPFGGGVAEPFLWSMVEMFVGDVWPNGDPAQLRAAGTAWSAFGRSMAGIAGQLEGPSATISGQQIPEGGAMASALSDLKQGLADICTESAKLGVQLFEFATDVESAQNAIRDLLSRLSPSGIFDAIGAVFSGDAMEELREIADDIRAVLDNLGRQANARQHSIQDVMQLIDGAVLSLQKNARKEFVDFFGEDVGNPVATAFDILTNQGQGILEVGLENIEGIQQLDPFRFAYDFEGAKETWGALGETAFYANPMTAILDPIGAFEHGKDMAEGFAHVDDWSTERPGLGPAKFATEIGSMLIPGVGATKATRAASLADDVAEGAGPTVHSPNIPGNPVSELGTVAERAENISGDLDNIGDNITPNASPNATGPAIPRDLAEPPRVGEAPPPTPTPLAPDGPPPHVPDSTPGDRAPVTPHNSTPTEAPRAPVDSGPPVDRTPAAAHSPTPTATSTQTADLPAGSQNSAPAPSAAASPSGSPPPPGIHAQEPVPAAAHAGSATSPFEGPAAGHFDDGSDLGGQRNSADGSGDTPDSGGRGDVGDAHEGDPYGPPNGGPGDSNNPGSNANKGDDDNNGDHGGNSGDTGGSSTSPDGGSNDPIHSHEPSGDGWERLADGPTDPHYGEPLPEHWTFSENPADRINPDVERLMTDPDAPFGRAPDGHAYTQSEYEERFNKLSPDGKPWQNFPGNDGAAPGTKVAYSDPRVYIEHYGNAVDRVGNADGSYLAVIENGQPAPWEGRALHVNSLSDPYKAYNLNAENFPEGWKIEVSEVGPGLGQPGGSIQVRVLGLDGKSVPVEILDKMGLLE